MAILEEQSHPDFAQRAHESMDAWLERTSQLLDEMMHRSVALPEGKLEGAVVHFPVADGRAFYLVTQEAPLTVQHLPFGDAWQVNHIMIRGLIGEDVHEMLQAERGVRALFTRKRGIPA